MLRRLARRLFTLCAAVAAAVPLCISGCGGPPAHTPSSVATTATSDVPRPLENGAYAVLREAPTPDNSLAEGSRQTVLTYDRSKYGNAPAGESLTYVIIDPADYVPLIIEGSPEMTMDSQGKSILSVTLTRASADKTEAFTRAHLGGRIAMVVDGEIVTLHKIRSVVSGGRLQITRCTDNACEIIRAKLAKE
jgi:hypothetical protein